MDEVKYLFMVFFLVSEKIMSLFPALSDFYRIVHIICPVQYKNSLRGKIKHRKQITLFLNDLRPKNTEQIFEPLLHIVGVEDLSAVLFPQGHFRCI